MDIKEKSLLDGVRSALAGTFSTIIGWLASETIRDEDMSKIIKDIEDIEDIIDKKIAPEFKKVNDKLDHHTLLFNGLFQALGKTPPPADAPKPPEAK